MKWYSSTVLFWVFLFVLVFSGASNVYSEQADITKAELMTLLNEREDLKTALITKDENFLKTLDQLEIEHQNDLTALENKYDQKIALLKIQSEIRIDSLTELKNGIIWNNIKSFLAGFGLGFGTGNFTGIKIGVTL